MHEWVDHNFAKKIAKLATTKAAETFEASAKFGNCKVLAKICIKLHLFGLIKNSEEDEIRSQQQQQQQRQQLKKLPCDATDFISKTYSTNEEESELSGLQN